MLNKKLLAVAVTAAMTAGFANATPTQKAVDLDGANGDLETGVVSYVKELTWGSDLAVVENDKVPVGLENGTASYVTANIGFTIAEGTNKYIRIDLARADGDSDAPQPTFESVPELKWDTVSDGGTPAAPARAANANNTGDIDADPRALTHNGRPNPQSSISEGGIGESYVIFEVNAFEADNNENEDIPSFLSFYVEAAMYKLPTDVVTTARYRLYEDAVDAQRENDEILKDTSNVDLARFVDGVQEEFTIPNSVYASVDSEYTVFLNSDSEFADHDETDFYDFQQSANDGDNDGNFDNTGNWGGTAVSATTASLGEVDTDLLVAAGNLLTDLDGGAFDNDDVVGEDPVITFTGDFSYGDWALAEVGVNDPAGEACDGGALIEENTLLSSLSAEGTLVFDSLTQQQIEDNDYVLCVNIDEMTSDVDDNLLVGMENPWENGNRIQESDYEAFLSWDPVLPAVIADETTFGWNELMGADATPVRDEMGSVIYDTITIDIPFMSTFEDYKQRFHLTNNGPTDATYMFEPTAEFKDGQLKPVPEEVRDGAQLSGIIPANSSIVVQAATIMGSFEGRTSGVLHIGGEDEDIGVSAVITNPQRGTIDIQDLNANSIKARKSNKLPEANGVN